MSGTNTLFALSSGRPPAAIGIIRISGPHAFDAVRNLTGRALPPPRTAKLRALHDPCGGAMLDKALVLVFPGPGSATGEDLAELHLHGGVAVISAVLNVLGRMEGLASAAPGAFTRRAFENGVLDLLQVEGLADLLAAETERQRCQALAHADGHLTQMAEAWREKLLDLLAAIEAGLDFSDEGDVDEAIPRADIEDLAGTMRRVLANPSGERLRDGVKLAIAGPPNAGKSSLINVLSKRDVAIVTPVPGTTRDRIEAHLAIGGIPFIAVDTAGLRVTADMIEREGIERARQAVAVADVVINMAGDDGRFESLETAAPIIRIISKSDLRDDEGEEGATSAGEVLHLSSVTGEGLDRLLQRLVAEAEALVGHGEVLALANERQRAILEACQAALSDSLHAESGDPVLVAEHLRQALNAIGKLTGRVGVEDMLDALFGRFCIGK